MQIETIFRELELLLSDMVFGGLSHVQPVTIGKLENLKKELDDAGMIEGSRRIDRLINLLRDHQAGHAGMEDVADAFCALEFYEKHCSNTMREANGLP